MIHGQAFAQTQHRACALWDAARLARVHLRLASALFLVFFCLVVDLLLVNEGAQPATAALHHNLPGE